MLRDTVLTKMHLMANGLQVGHRSMSNAVAPATSGAEKDVPDKSADPVPVEASAATNSTPGADNSGLISFPKSPGPRLVKDAGVRLLAPLTVLVAPTVIAFDDPAMAPKMYGIFPLLPAAKTTVAPKAKAFCTANDTVKDKLGQEET